MTEETLSKIVEQSIGTNLERLNEVKMGTTKEKLGVFLKLVTGDLMGAVESAGQIITDYKESEFFRKYLRYIYELVDITPEERHKFVEEIREKAEDMPGNILFGIVDRMDNINKEEILAKLTIAKINGWISIEDFFRLTSMLERIPYVDLKQLPYYKEPYYDESGDTELLYATGALEVQTIDANGTNKYILSILGEKLLKYGFAIQIELEHGKGTKMELDTMKKEEINRMFDEIKESTPKVIGEALEWHEA